MRLLVRRVRTTLGERDLRIAGRKIQASATGLAARRRERVLDGRGMIALPGLINAHDHLSLNLLPPLGTPPYASVYAFAEDVYRPEEAPLRPLQGDTRVRDRLWWGAYKNLIAGVTTVVHHDPFTRRIFRRRFPVKVLRRYGWSHSLRFGPDPAAAHRACRGAPFIIHAAEGVDPEAGSEIDRLDALGVLAPGTVLVHAIQTSPAQRQKLAASGAGVVWCPHSNLRLYAATAAIDALRADGIPVALGTDATMSGASTLLDEVRDALATGLADPDQVLAMVTGEAARLFGFGDGRGTLETGAPADLVLLPAGDASPAETLATAGPADIALVLVDGEARVADPVRAEHLGLAAPNAWIDGAPKHLYGDLARLRARLLADAGPEALAAGALWCRLTSSEQAVPNGQDPDREWGC